jgi:carboxylesterase
LNVPADRLTPFSAGHGKTGILLSHGFTGTPADMRNLALDLATQGFRVSNLLLKGHAAGEEALASTRWPDWWQSFKTAYAALRAECERVLVCGFSMGGTLALKLCAEEPVAGAMILAAPIFLRGALVKLVPALSHFIRFRPAGPASVFDPVARAAQPDVGRTPLASLASFCDLARHVDGLLPQVTCPLLLIYSRKDHVVPFANMAHIAARVRSSVVRTQVLERSDHVITVDYDRDQVRDEVLAFARELGGSTA